MYNQQQLPIFPSGVTEISNSLSFKKENGAITYFNCTMPVFTHDETDMKTFRMITSQFHLNGHATQAEIARAFGVTLISVKRSVKLYREKGIKGFYEQRNGRGASVLTEEVLAKIQLLLNDGIAVKDIALQMDIKKDTIRKAIQANRLTEFKKKTI